MEDLRQELAVYLKRYLRTRNMSKTELARKAGVSRATIVNIEKGAHSVSLDNFCSIATALKLRPHSLLRDMLESKKLMEISATEVPDAKQREEVNLVWLSVSTQRGDHE